MSDGITGTTAVEISDSIRSLIDRGVLAPGDALPPVRDLAVKLSVNRNTANAAYRRLAEAGLTTGRGRAGTVIAAAPRSPRDAQHDPSLIDLGSGSPDPSLIPTASVTSAPGVYGAPAIDEGLRQFATEHFFADFGHPTAQLAVTSGALDAIERILAAEVGRDELVAIEDPGLLSSIDTARIGGFRVVGVRVDREGLDPQSLSAALQAGARAIVYTPRAQNPTGACLSEARADELRAILADFPDVLLVEDDHFAPLSAVEHSNLITPDRSRFALVRSVSAALGPDASIALVAADATTTAHLRHRQGPGSIWVSHALQRLVHKQLSDPKAQEQLATASAHYLQRGRDFATAINELGVAGLSAHSGCGLNTWVALPRPAKDIVGGLAERGWRVRGGDEFAVHPRSSRHIRVTAHQLDPHTQSRFLADLVDTVTSTADET